MNDKLKYGTHKIGNIINYLPEIDLMLFRPNG